jgi:hypothetical protein
MQQRRAQGAAPVQPQQQKQTQKQKQKPQQPMKMIKPLKHQQGKPQFINKRDRIAMQGQMVPVPVLKLVTAPQQPPQQVKKQKPMQQKAPSSAPTHFPNAKFDAASLKMKITIENSDAPSPWTLPAVVAKV